MALVRRVLPPLALALCLAAPGSSHADPPRSESDPCRNRHAGDACEADDFEGTCRRRRCTRETDDGLRTFHCLVCESRHHGHHRRRHRDAAAEPDDVTAPDDAALAADDASTDVLGDVSGDVTADATPDVPARRDAAVVARLTPPPKRSLFDCAATPARGDGSVCGALLAALCVALQGRGRRRTGGAR